MKALNLILVLLSLSAVAQEDSSIFSQMDKDQIELSTQVIDHLVSEQKCPLYAHKASVKFEVSSSKLRGEKIVASHTINGDLAVVTQEGDKSYMNLFLCVTNSDEQIDQTQVSLPNMQVIKDNSCAVDGLVFNLKVPDSSGIWTYRFFPVGYGDNRSSLCSDQADEEVADI